MRSIKKGATSQSIYFDVLDTTSTTGGRKTGLAYNSSGLTTYYVRNQGSATQITLATLAAANSAFSSGGFKEVDATNMPGLYRLDVPDAAFASGADTVVITIKGVTGMAQVSDEIQLVDNNAADVMARIGAAGAGLTSLGDARIAHLDADVSTRSTYSGGAVASVTGSVGSVAGNVGGNVTGSVGSVAGITASDVGAIKAKTDNLPASPAATGAAMTLTAAYDAAKTAASQASVDDLPTNAELATALAGADDATLAAIAALPTAVTVNAIKAKTDNLPSDPADASDIASAFATVATAFAALPTAATVNAIKAKTDNLPGSPAATGDAMTLTVAYDAAKTAASQASVDDLPTNAELATALAGADDATLAAIAALPTAVTVNAIKAKTDNLPSDPADASDIASAFATVATAFAALPTAATVNAIKAKTDNLPGSPAATGDAMTLTLAYDAAKTAATQASVDDLPTNAELATALAGADDATLAAIAALPVAAIKAKTDLIPGTIDGKTFAEHVTLQSAVLFGKASGLATTTVRFRSLDDAKDRVVATVDESGNRSAVTLDAS